MSYLQRLLFAEATPALPSHLCCPTLVQVDFVAQWKVFSQLIGNLLSGLVLPKTSRQKKASEGYVLGAGSMDIQSIPGMTSMLMLSQTHFELPWKSGCDSSGCGFSFVTGTESRHGVCLS